MSKVQDFNPPWADWPEEQLLNLKMCDLKLRLEGTYVENCIRRVYGELESHGIAFKPLCYLGDEWFSPDNIAAIAIPFYLMHPRLKQLEQKLMLEVEGGSESECLKLLRHETGHAFCHAFQLSRRPQWKTIFGSSSREFNDFYHYQPYSKRFVRHLENCYAQSHPEEDFAETFAVWLSPEEDWKTLYQGWPALSKLFYVDKLVRNLKGRIPGTPPPAKLPFDIRCLRRRLKTHYEQRRKFYSEDDPGFFDSDLYHIFAGRDQAEHGQPASRFLRRERGPLLEVISFWTRERKFTVNRLLRKLMTRCDELKLYLPHDETRAHLEITAYLAALVSNYLFTGKFKGHA